MSSHRFQSALEIGRQAQTAAGQVRNSLFPRWRQRRFRHHLGRFIKALEHVPQQDAAKLSSEHLRALSAVVDGVVATAEVFLAERQDATIKEVEQDRFVVTEIYHLRAIVETLTRHMTANPDLIDVKWSVATEPRNQPKP